MTAHELARALLAGPDIMVTVRGYEGGVDEIRHINEPIPINLNYNTEWYYGKHEYWIEGGEDIKPETMAIHIGLLKKKLMTFPEMNPRIICQDGCSLSVQTNEYTYCTPRNNEGPYTAVEVGFIMDKDNNPVTPPVSWKPYSDDSFPSDIYAYVPLELVNQFIQEHGGINSAKKKIKFRKS